MTMDPHTAKLHRRLAAECSVPDGMLLSGMEEGEVERNMRIIRDTTPKPRAYEGWGTEH